MPTAVLTKGKALVPFLGDKLSFIRGLDLLGLQITSEATYTILLPGLTNVTNRIRYYGFNCWLLQEYALRVGEVDPESQQDFVRRAELLVAILVRHIDRSAINIPGSEFADKLIDQNTGAPYRLDEGADTRANGNAGTYWKARLGALGQYYAGSLRALGLIGTSAHHEKLLVRTSRQVGRLTGEELANEFAHDIPADIQELFLSSVKRGRLNPNDIKTLAAYFDLSRLRRNGAEQVAYLSMLTGADYPALHTETPSYHRLTSLRLLLAHMQQHQPEYPWVSFLINNYDSQGDGTDEPTRRGWYYYQLNEYWQFASSSVLEALLRRLEAVPGGYAYLPNFLTQFTQEVLEQMAPDLPSQPTLDDLLTTIHQTGSEEEDFVDECLAAQTDQDPPLQAAAAFGLLGSIYQRNLPHLPQLREYAQPLGLLREGNFLAYAELLTQYRDWPLGQFIQHFIYHDVIVRHQYVAMRKMGGGHQSTLKFEIEGEWVRCLDTIQARFSTPRLNILLQMAIDLGLLNDDHILTARGRNFLA
ncbi:hypothetical protein HNQ93_001716 [Hymenobacter luteus]|uniref:Uncharacterized protein n=2 Tax=Hymenobacter TaxID=89966 RepID=A0A7W9SZX9_9BACT|nr:MULTISPECIES: hypothetical protein [Hymenobacter]MBB4600923.1 hypothetical protein [Hymenobacter latericoloratus]MBB6058870.1 hypothetical protein [Hymenobacter luteus]